jgi:thiol-disulfide isomerase/thioredoxin
MTNSHASCSIGRWLPACILLLLIATAPAADPPQPVPIGTVIQDLRFTDIRGLDRNLSELGESPALVLAFTTTTCPLVRKSLPKLTELARKYQDQGVRFVIVNVGAGDTIRDMAAQAVDFEVPLVFVKDEDHSCCRALGITRTPQVAVLDATRTLRYRGRIDDQLRIGGTRPVPTRHDLEVALQEILAGQPVSIAETTVDGCAITPPPSRPQQQGITWSEHIAGIVHARCAQCHRPGTAAPFSLLTYDEVSAHSEMIKVVVARETMPPWYAARQHGHFQNNAALSEAEQGLILDWIALGRPVGEISQAPAPPEPATSEWRIGEPDLVITTIEEFTIPATGFIPYRYTVLPFLTFQETWIEAIEIKPDNRAVVHHCNMAYITSEGAGEQTFITGYVPGGQPMDASRFNHGVAVRLPARAGLGLQIHFTTTGKEERCRIQVGLRFPRGVVRKQLRHFLIDPHRWQIPPHDPAFRVEGTYTLDRDVELLGLFTHMHLRGRDMTFYAEAPGQSRERLLQIPNYNFEWQLGYEIGLGEKPLSKGTVIRAVAHFDNSAFNPYNPDPSATVVYGPQSVDEMFNGFGFYVDRHESLNIRVNPQTGHVVTVPESDSSGQ